MKHVVIVGAGISGLSTAWFCQKFSPLKITLIEKSDRVGGWIGTTVENGFLFEKGPRGFRPSGQGKLTCSLAKDVGLSDALIYASPAAKKRYLWLKDKLTPFSPFLLLRYGFLSAAWREWRHLPSQNADESIRSFFVRHFNPQLADHILEPIVQGIFGGRSATLSLQTCFPVLAQWEQQYGSILKGFWKLQKEKMPSLASFRNGMETLPRAIASRLQADILLSTNLEKIEGTTLFTSGGKIEADHIVLTTPLHFSQPFLSLTTVHIGFSTPVLRKQGFGYLSRLTEEHGVLGMTWDSEIFPTQDSKPLTRLCLMLRGEYSNKEAKAIALKTLQNHLQIDKPPDHLQSYVAKQAVPQFPPGFAPPSPLPHLSYTGSAFGAVGVNGCISHAFQTVESFLQQSNCR